MDVSELPRTVNLCCTVLRSAFSGDTSNLGTVESSWMSWDCFSACAWRSGEGRDSRAPYREFLQKSFAGYEHGVPKKDRVWLGRCLAQLRGSNEAHPPGAAVSALDRLPRNRRVPTSVARVPRALRQRAAGLQGASYKCPELRELLWD